MDVDVDVDVDNDVHGQRPAVSPSPSPEPRSHPRERINLHPHLTGKFISLALSRRRIPDQRWFLFYFVL